MFKLKYVFRNLYKYKTASLFSVFSLIVAFLGCTVMIVYVAHEKSYDKFHADYNRIYRVENLFAGERITATLNPFIQKLPEVEVSDVINFANYFYIVSKNYTVRKSL